MIVKIVLLFIIFLLIVLGTYLLTLNNNNADNYVALHMVSPKNDDLDNL